MTPETTSSIGLYDLGTLAVIAVSLISLVGPMVYSFYRSMSKMGDSVEAVSKQFLANISEANKQHADAQTQDNEQIYLLIKETTTHMQQTNEALRNINTALSVQTDELKKTNTAVASHDDNARRWVDQITAELRKGASKRDEIAVQIAVIVEALEKLKSIHEDMDKSMSRRMEAMEKQLQKLINDLSKQAPAPTAE